LKTLQLLGSQNLTVSVWSGPSFRASTNSARSQFGFRMSFERSYTIFSARFSSGTRMLFEHDGKRLIKHKKDIFFFQPERIVYGVAKATP